MADEKKKYDRVLEHYLTCVAYQYLKLHPELESVTFRLSPHDKRSVETKKTKKGT